MGIFSPSLTDPKFTCVSFLGTSKIFQIIQLQFLVLTLIVGMAKSSDQYSCHTYMLGCLKISSTEVISSPLVTAVSRKSQDMNKM